MLEHALIEKVTTDYYKVLKVIFNTKITVNNNTFSPITKSEIAERINVSTITINTIIGQIKKII